MKHLYCLVVLIFLFGCKPTIEEDGEFLIVATTGMLEDIIKSITGDRATVVSLMGPGVDPHLYKATLGDLKALKKADIVIYNGLHLEGKMGEIMEKLSKFPGKTIVAAAEVIDEEHLIVVDEKNNIHDPHIWFDVALWSETIQPVSEAIINFDPANENFYRQNAETKRTELKQLDSWVHTEINKVPKKQRKLITAHDAFAYFGEAYDIEVQGLQGLSTLSEAGIKDVTNLVDDIVENNIKAVFVESSVPQKGLQAVIEGAEEKGWSIGIGGTLFSDAMGAQGTPEGTYKGMVEHNIKTIVNALK